MLNYEQDNVSLARHVLSKASARIMLANMSIPPRYTTRHISHWLTNQRDSTYKWNEGTIGRVYRNQFGYDLKDWSYQLHHNTKVSVLTSVSHVMEICFHLYEADLITKLHTWKEVSYIKKPLPSEPVCVSIIVYHLVLENLVLKVIFWTAKQQQQLLLFCSSQFYGESEICSCPQQKGLCICCTCSTTLNFGPALSCLVHAVLDVIKPQ